MSAYTKLLKADSGRPVYTSVLEKSVWSAENLNKTSDYHLRRTLINIEKKFSQDWSAEDQAYWTTYYNKVEEELIERGYYERQRLDN